MASKFTVTAKDLEISYFSGSGAGGQHRNKHMNCVRMYHPDSGVRVTAQDHRERSRNISDALERLSNHPKFKFFCEQKLKEIEGLETIEQTVEKQVQEAEVFLQKPDGEFYSEKTGDKLDKLVYGKD